MLRHRCFAVILMMLIACNDFLEIKPKGSMGEEQLYSKEGVEALLIGAYALLDGHGASNGVDFVGWEAGASNWIYGSVAGGDAHVGSQIEDPAVINILPIETYEALPSSDFLNKKWIAVYEGVARANAVLNVLGKTTDISETDRMRMAGEARGLRGIYLLEGKKMWANVPYIHENDLLKTVKNDLDIWNKIEEDFFYAYTTLPETLAEVGRINKWAAASFYARTLIFQRKFSEAKIVLEDIYLNGKNPKGIRYQLFPHFGDAFDVEKENGMESVFAVQNSVNDGTFSNGGAGEVLNYPFFSDYSSCCGFFQPSIELVNSYRTNEDGLPLLDGTYNHPQNEVKHDMGLDSGEPFTEDSGNLDPRLDWTVGRRGISYYDWGEHSGKAWIRDQNFGGPYLPKKYIYKLSQQGQYTEQSSWANGFTANNFMLIRFAEVILWLAECEAEIGSADRAREYVNEIRMRAANPDGWVTDPDGTPAARYHIGLYPPATFPFDSKENALKAVYFERKLELAMEGHRFFDLVRWGQAERTLNAYLDYEQDKIQYLSGKNFVAGKHEYYPIPQKQIDLTGASILSQNPGY